MKYNVKPIKIDGVDGFGVFTGKRWWAETWNEDKAVVKMERAASRSFKKMGAAAERARKRNPAATRIVQSS